MYTFSTCSRCLRSGWFWSMDRAPHPQCSVCLGVQPSTTLVTDPIVLPKTEGGQKLLYAKIIEGKMLTEETQLELTDWDVRFLHENQRDPHPESNSDFVMEPNDKIEGLVLQFVERGGPVTTEWGTSYAYRFLHAGKNKVEWFTGTESAAKLVPGQQIRCTSGRIKDHKTIGGVRVTSLVRVKYE